MFVLQIFVMRNGALESVEMACGDRIVVGPPRADVPLAGVEGAGVALALDGERIIATPLGSNVRIDGELACGPTPLTPGSELCIGEVAVKVRRPAATRTAPASVELGGLAAQAATVPDVPLAALATTANQDLAPTPFALLAADEDVDDADDEDDLEPDWSLLEALARPAEGPTGALVEVVRSQGERVLEHTLLDGSETFALAGRALVTRRARGGCDIALPSGAVARARRGGELTDVLAGPAPITLALAAGDAATVRVGESVLLVRFAHRPQVAWSTGERLARRAEQRAQALCASAGLALSAASAGVLWLLEFRDRELAVPLDDEDITQWPDVELAMQQPKREPEPEPIADRLPKPTEATPPSARKLARVESSRRPPAAEAARSPSVLDIAAGLPALKSNRAIDAALTNMRAPLPARPGGLIVQPLIDRSAGVAGRDIAGSGLSTVAGAEGLKRGAGSLEKGAARVIGGTVARGKLRDLRVPTDRGLSREQILKVINAHVGEIQGCYERGLRDDGGLGGRVVVSWSITAAGVVSVTRVQTSTLGAAGVERCMLEHIEKWRFPASPGRSEVVFPFSFSAL